MVSSELYGWTTTSPDSVLGKTEYVWMSFFGKRSLSRSRRKEPRPEPVPPAIEWRSINPWGEQAKQDGQGLISGVHGKRDPTCATRQDRPTHLKRVAAVGFAVDHVEKLLVDPLTGVVSHSPVVSRSASVLINVDVLGVVKVRKWGALDVVDDLKAPKGGQSARINGE